MRLSRRSVLGAGVVAVGGAAAVGVGQQSRGRRWLHSIGLVDGPDLPPPDVDVPVQWNTLSSEHMHGDVSWGMSLPDDPQAVLLCLHGRGASHRFAFDTMGVHRFVDDAGLQWAVVAADGGAASYWHRRAAVDPQAMMFDELLPVVTRRAGRLPLAVLAGPWEVTARCSLRLTDPATSVRWRLRVPPYGRRSTTQHPARSTTPTTFRITTSIRVLPP